jgi:hypothetical protein
MKTCDNCGSANWFSAYICGDCGAVRQTTADWDLTYDGSLVMTINDPQLREDAQNVTSPIGLLASHFGAAR